MPIVYNSNVDLAQKSKRSLIIGAVGCLLGVGYQLANILYALDYSPVGISDTGAGYIIEGLFVALLAGVSFGYLGLGSLYGQSLATTVGVIRLIMILDMYFLGLMSALPRAAHVIVGVVVLGLEVAAFVMIFRVARFRFVYLAAAVLVVIDYALSWLLAGDLGRSIAGLFDAVLLAALFALAAYDSHTAKLAAPGPLPGIGGYPPPGGYPPAGGYPPPNGYPPSGGYPPPGGGAV